MANLPIVKMTLYKHGVGFFTREGKVDGQAAALTFRKEEMNDVLKSLTALAAGGGRVLGVDYETPADKAERLTHSSLHLSDDASLRDMLRDLRGRSVTITTKESAGEGAGAIEGLVVGVDLPGEREAMGETVVSILSMDGGVVRPVRLADIHEIRLVDARAASDLRYFLETSRTEEEKRAVTIHLSPGTPELRASYIAPSPVWRVSYRLVVDAAGGAEKATGLLQGWGLFDNTLDEDLENVELTFVSGMPVSFVYDLYTPFTPERPTVHEEGRTVAAPVEFQAALPASAPVAPGFGAGMLRDLGAETKEFRRMAPKAEQFAESTAVAAAGRVQGEYFSYVVSDPVTVRRGRSAMAPILQGQWEFRKERIYNGRKQPLHPVITMRFKNGSGLTLERGPVTVIEAGEYAGEAMLPFTGPDGELFLAYAVDLGITVTEEAVARQEVTQVSVRDGLLFIQEDSIQKVDYTIANRTDRSADVIVEHPRAHNYKVDPAPELIEETPDALRYRVHAPAHGTATFPLEQRRLVARREELRDQNLEQLQRWLREGKLKTDLDKLSSLLKLYEQIKKHELQLKNNDAMRQEILNQQKIIQGNLSALKPTGEEAQLRTRYARTLQEQEDRLAALKRDDERQRQLIEETKTRIAEAVNAL